MSSQIVKTIYSQQVLRESPMIEDWYDRIVFYELGRVALFELAKALKLKGRSRILLPKFSCKEVIEPFVKAGFDRTYYEVDEHLDPVLTDEMMEKVDTILYVNYFGFPSSFPIKYSDYKEVFVIEDNAHGAFGSFEGNVLGCRSDAGIFSFRKTSSLISGAGVYLPSNSAIELKGSEFRNETRNRSKKEWLKQFPFLLSPRVIQKLTELYRKMRPLPNVSSDVTCYEKHETTLNTERLALFDFEIECKRRKKLWSFCHELLKDTSAKALFQELPEGVCPYGYAFQSEKIEDVQSVLKSVGMEAFPWPAFHEEIGSDLSPEIKNVWIVRFVW